MLFAILLFLMVLSPLFVPVAVTVVDVYDNWRTRRAVRPIRPPVGLLPAPAQLGLLTRA